MSPILDFIDSSPSPFHAIKRSMEMLLSKGFTQLCERKQWDVKLGGKYFVVRNSSALVAFAVGKECLPASGFSIVGAHSDSPCLKMKPRSARMSAGYLQLGVQTYGGGLWHTWFDRDLGLAGRVFVKTKEHLIEIRQPILRVPSLAIHLDRSVKDAFSFNTETNLLPVLCSGDAPESRSHHTVLLEKIAEKLDCAIDDIWDVELSLFDVQPSIIGGMQNEYLFASRCDNLVMSYCAVSELCEAKADAEAIPMVVLFDNEEVGSQSSYGAQSFLPSVLRRVKQSLGHLDAFDQSIARSFCISADMAHAVHPNYVQKHDDLLRPKMNCGVVLKFNCNQRYATTAATAALTRALANLVDVPLQEFAVRNDSPCGTTIGPIVSSLLGMRCVDVGNPQLSMHSIREQAGVYDIGHAKRLFGAFFEKFSKIDVQ